MRPRFEIGVLVVLSLMLVAWIWPAVERMQRRHALVNHTAAIVKDIEQWQMDRALWDARLARIDRLLRVNYELKKRLDGCVTPLDCVILKPERKRGEGGGRARWP